MEVEFWATTDAGRVRDHNEDNFLVDSELKLFVVCDGMGGHAAGEVASAMSVKTIHEAIIEQRGIIDKLGREPANAEHRKAVLSLMERAITAASDRIYAAAQQDAERSGMGTTCSALLLCAGRAFVGHVGDSRIYRLCDGGVEQLTQDHSLINEMIRQGKANEGDSIPNQNAVTRAVGVREAVEVDTFDFAVDVDDRFLLCSDGLSGYIESDDELRALMEGEDLESITRACIEHALDGGGKDNITAIVLTVCAMSGDGASRPDSRMAEHLSATPYFAHASDPELVQLVEIAERHHFEAGGTIVERGQPVDALCLILEGSVGVLGAGEGVIVLDAGDTFGALGLFAEKSDQEAYEALEPVTLLALRREPLFELLRARPELASKVLFGVARSFANKLRRVPSELRFEPKRWDEVSIHGDQTPPPGSMVVQTGPGAESGGVRADIPQRDTSPVNEVEQAASLDSDAEAVTERQIDAREMRKTLQIDLNGKNSDEM